MLREISNKETVRLGSIESQNKLLIILRKLTKELIIKQSQISFYNAALLKIQKNTRILLGNCISKFPK